jgi:hypothetical protein
MGLQVQTFSAQRLFNALLCTGQMRKAISVKPCCCANLTSKWSIRLRNQLSSVGVNVKEIRKVMVPLACHAHLARLALQAASHSSGAWYPGPYLALEDIMRIAHHRPGSTPAVHEQLVSFRFSECPSRLRLAEPLRLQRLRPRGTHDS